MNARRMLELLVASTIACGEPSGEAAGGTSSPLGGGSIDPTTRAEDLGIDDTLFRRVDSQPFIQCPPDTPFMCRSRNAAGWACSEVACAPSCEKIGCPGGFQCLDCGSGAECAPPDYACR